MKLLGLGTGSRSFYPTYENQSTMLAIKQRLFLRAKGVDGVDGEGGRDQAGGLPPIEMRLLSSVQSGIHSIILLTLVIKYFFIKDT